MIISIENLGSIRNAEIDLSKQLIVFCGQNGTGKTYLSYVIDYFINNCPAFVNTKKGLSKNQSETLYSTGNLKFEIERKVLVDYIKDLCYSEKSDLGDLFALSDDDVDKLFPNFSMSVSIPTDKDILDSKFSQSLNANGRKYHIVKEEGKSFVSVNIISSDNIETEELMEKSLKSTFDSHILYSCIFNNIIFGKQRRATILPVERNSIYTFNKELSLHRNMVIDQMQKLARNEKISPFDLLKHSSRRYPKSIIEGLTIANDLNTIKKKKGFYYDIACNIEKQLLHGSLDTTSDGDVIFKINKTNKLPIQIASSMIKTMASLFFYVKYIAKEGDIIIIDEPEMNLHPNNQVLFVEIILTLINNGLRFIISTHSDYIVREINKYIMLDTLILKKGKCPNNFNKICRLSVKDVDMYYFKASGRDRKVSVERLGVDSENCYTISSMDETINRQNSEIEQLFNELYS